MRWFAGKSPPIVPITINTCYPPNWISPKRAYALGRAVREAIESWDSDLTVAVATSGGLSHFVVDEELDRLALKGMEEANGEMLTVAAARPAAVGGDGDPELGRGLGGDGRDEDGGA